MLEVEGMLWCSPTKQEKVKIIEFETCSKSCSGEPRIAADLISVCIVLLHFKCLLDQQYHLGC